MKTMTLKEFAINFMDISNNLTNSEMRILYLLIIKPDWENITQMDLARDLHVDRRTINIGLKKLKELEYIENNRIGRTYDNKSPDKTKMYQSDNVRYEMPTSGFSRAKKLLIKTFIDYYAFPINKNIVVNEDFYSHVLGNLELHKNIRYNKKFVTETLRNSFPNAKFYFELDKAYYDSETHFNINRAINFEINNARNTKIYHIKIDKLIETLWNNYSINENEVIQVIRKDFRKLHINKNRILIPNPILKKSQRMQKYIKW